MLAAVYGDAAFETDSHSTERGARFAGDRAAEAGDTGERHGGGDHGAGGNGDGDAIDGEVYRVNHARASGREPPERRLRAGLPAPQGKRCLFAVSVMLGLLSSGQIRFNRNRRGAMQ